MIQRLIYTALQSGLTQIENDPMILEYLFTEQFPLPATEVAAIKTLFQNTPPVPHHSLLPTDASFPAYAIQLGNEDESEHVLGSDGGQVTDEDSADFGADCITSFWDHKYHVHCYSEHPDVTTYIYEVAKSIMIGSEDYLIDNGIQHMHLSGMDLIPDPRYAPAHAFVRQLTVGFKSEFMRLDRLSRLQKAFRVRGIHVDSSGSPSDVGGVKTNVTPYEVDDA